MSQSMRIAEFHSGNSRVELQIMVGSLVKRSPLLSNPLFKHDAI